MKGKVVGAVQNLVIIKPDVMTDTKGIKILNYKILYNNKIVGEISNVIGRVDNFFLVGEIQNEDIVSAIVGKDVEIKRRKGVHSK